MTCKDCIHFELCEIDGHSFMTLLGAGGYENEAERCIRFKDKSRFVELPCKVGDTVYFVDTECDYFNCYDRYDWCFKRCEKANKYCVKETIIKQFRITGDRRNSMTDANGLCSSDENDFYFRDIGEKVFFTKEEAEKALRERTGK